MSKDNWVKDVCLGYESKECSKELASLPLEEAKDELNNWRQQLEELAVSAALLEEGTGMIPRDSFVLKLKADVRKEDILRSARVELGLIGVELFSSEQLHLCK